VNLRVESPQREYDPDLHTAHNPLLNKCTSSNLVGRCLGSKGVGGSHVSTYATCTSAHLPTACISQRAHLHHNITCTPRVPPHRPHLCTTRNPHRAHLHTAHTPVHAHGTKFCGEQQSSMTVECSSVGGQRRNLRCRCTCEHRRRSPLQMSLCTDSALIISREVLSISICDSGDSCRNRPANPRWGETRC